MSILTILRDKDLQKLSIIRNIPLLELQRVYDSSLLDIKAARNILIKDDYRTLIATRTDMSTTQVIKYLSNDYHLTTKGIEAIVYEKKSIQYTYCRECAKKIARAEAKAYKGLCFSCFNKTIKN